MKNLLALACLLALPLSSLFSQVPVQMRTGVFINEIPTKSPSTHPAIFGENLYQGRYYLWLQFNALPTAAQKSSLELSGVEFYDYLPSNTYIASFPQHYDFAGLRSYNVYGVMKPPYQSKIDAKLFDASSIPWAAENDSTRSVYVNCIASFTPGQVANILLAEGIIFTLIEGEVDPVLAIKASMQQLQLIAAHPLVQYIEAVSPPPVFEDEQGISNHRNNPVSTSDNYVTGRKYDGSGIVIALGDDGFIGPHLDYTGRILINASNTSTANTHADHVAGIIFGAPNFNPKVKGQAPGAMLRVYNSYADLGLFPTIYSTNQVRISSHSLGQTCNAGYNSNARSSDQQIRLYPSMMHVHSAGNSGTETCGGLSGWRTITGGYKAGKNVIAVANLTKSDVISSSSSKGPTPDGRIKPDVAAVGSSINSTQPNNTYASNSGTSMSCPAVSGTLAVLNHAYKTLNGGTEANSGLIKAILMNTADDIGNPGPDFTYGWGRINARRAIECLEQQRYLTGSISQGTTNTHNIPVPENVDRVKIMVYWVDREATVGAAKILVNDLNTAVTTPSTSIVQPWVMNAGITPSNLSCSTPAITGIDTLNNMEQVQIDFPVAGNYTVNIEAVSVPFGPQDYYVVYEFYYADQIVVTYPFGGESFVPGETQRIRWDATSGLNTFAVAYSLNGGVNWTNINSSVSATQRYQDWTVPSTVTSNARIRVTRNGFTDVSDTSFVILSVPTGVTFNSVCEASTTISWNAVSGATGYDVFKLGTMYMEVLASTSTTSVTVTNLDPGQNWFAVRAKFGQQAFGRRTNAIAHTNTSSLPCPMPVRLTSFTATKRGVNAEISWTTSQESNIVKYIVERSSSPLFDDMKIIGEVKATNTNSIHEYKLNDLTTNGKGVHYYRLRTVEADKELYSKLASVKWSALAQSISIYPNPTSTTLFINSDDDFGAVQVEVYNASGIRMLLQQQTLNAGSNHTLNVGGLPNGQYLLMLRDSKGELISRQQFVILK